jgi:quinol monooxygenase YgiN
VIIVAGSLVVDDRDAYLAGCRAVVEQARRTPGCLDFALSPDLLDDDRITVLERWADEASLQAFRGSGPSDEQGARIRSADVAEYRV